MPFSRNIVCTVVALLLITLLCLKPAWAEEFQPRLLRKEAEALQADREAVKGAPNALLITPLSGGVKPATDPRSNASFEGVCYVYVDENGLLVRRFAVHVPDRELLPVARRAGRFFAHLWGMAGRRFGTRASGLRRGAVDVWLTKSGEAGGEQFGSNIYVYDALAERSGLEWARELAHEYGHYLLPGASGYTEPENWSNGVLGERLFLKWLDEDLRAGTLDAGAVPFVKAADLQEYRVKQVDPLLDYMRATAPSPSSLAGRDKRSMNLFSGLLLYVDHVYGSVTLYDLLDYLPQNGGRASGADFLTAFELWAKNSERFATQLAPGDSSMVFLPAGGYRIVGGGAPITNVSFGKGVTVTKEASGWRVRMAKPAWTAITVSGAASPVMLRWERIP